MRDELALRLKLVDEKTYLEALGFVKLLPGPVSSLLAIFLGMEIAGVWGGLISLFCFIFPSFFALLLISFFESPLREFFAPYPALAYGFEALQAAVIFLILYTCYRLFRECWEREYFGERRSLAVLLFFLGAIVAAWLQVPELIILLAAASLGSLFYWLHKNSSRSRLSVLPLVSLFGIFFLAGLSVFGTGYMILPHLERVLVTQYGLLSPADFLNAVTLGNLTPGPVVIAATPMGFKIGGLSGALTATVGIFLGPLLLMLCLKPLSKKLLSQKWVEGAWLGLLPAVAATIALSTLVLGLKMEWGYFKIFLGLLCFFLCLRKKSIPKIFMLIFILAALYFEIPKKI